MAALHQPYQCPVNTAATADRSNIATAFPDTTTLHLMLTNLDQRFHLVFSTGTVHITLVPM